MLYETINPVILRLKNEIKILRRELELANRELEYLREGPFSPKADSWNNADIRPTSKLPPRIELMQYGRGDIEIENPYRYKVIAETSGDHKYSCGFYADTNQTKTKEDAVILLMSIMEHQARKIAEDY